MIGLRRLVRGTGGASAVEFALIAPVLITMLFGLIEYGRLMWTRQAVYEAAFSSARCASMDTASCNTTATIRSYAVTRAGANGVKLIQAEITPTLATSCNGYTSNRVVISHPMTTVLPAWFTAFPATITATACFPARAANT